MPEADDPTVADEGQAEAPQSEAEEPTSPETPPPWGDDFDPARAWKTITHLRDRERELEPNAKALERLRSGEDRDTFRELAEQFGYEIPEDDEPDDDTDDDQLAPLNSKLSELEQWKQQQEQEKAVALFKQDVDQLAKDAELTLKERDYKQIWRDAEDLAAASKKPFDRGVVEQVFKDMLEDRKEFERAVIERYTGSKKAPQSPGSSKSATQVPDLDDPKVRAAWLKEQVALRERSQ